MTVYILIVHGEDRIMHCEVFSQEPTIDVHDVLAEYKARQVWLVMANVNGGDSIVLQEA